MSSARQAKTCQFGSVSNCVEHNMVIPVGEQFQRLTSIRQHIHHPYSFTVHTRARCFTCELVGLALPEYIDGPPRHVATVADQHSDNTSS